MCAEDVSLRFGIQRNAEHISLRKHDHATTTSSHVCRFVRKSGSTRILYPSISVADRCVIGQSTLASLPHPPFWMRLQPCNMLNTNRHPAQANLYHDLKLDITHCIAESLPHPQQSSGVILQRRHHQPTSSIIHYQLLPVSVLMFFRSNYPSRSCDLICDL